MWPVRNKTIIGLKFVFNILHNYLNNVRNKTIIGLKYWNTDEKFPTGVRNKTIIGLKCSSIIATGASSDC